MSTHLFALRSPGRVVRLLSPDTGTSYDYSQFRYGVNQRQFVQFRVRTCNDAHVGLFYEYGSGEKEYEIVFGGSGNTLTFFRNSTMVGSSVFHIRSVVVYFRHTYSIHRTTVQYIHYLQLKYVGDLGKLNLSSHMASPHNRQMVLEFRE